MRNISPSLEDIVKFINGKELTVIKRENPVKKCVFCQFSKWFEDRSVGIMGGYECYNPNIPEDYEEDLPNDEEGVNCQFFSPRNIEKCANCGVIMNTPEWLWPFWCQTEGGTVPCCCEFCVSKLSIRINIIEEEYQDER